MGTWTVDMFKEELRRVAEIPDERKRIVIQSTCEPDPAVLDLMKRYAPNYTMFGLINASAGWTELRRGLHHLDTYFERIVVSHETGIRKPHLDMFKSFLALTGCQAQTCLFIDNEPENVAAAASLGFQTHMFKDADELRRHLESLP